MLEFDELDTLSTPILVLYEKYTQSVLNEIARRLMGMKLTSSTAWMMQRLTESGLIYEHALKELEKLTGLSEKELRRAFRMAGVNATRFDDQVYRAAGLKPLPLNLSPAMTQVLAAGLRKTDGVLRNLTLTTALSAQNAFIDAVDLAYMQVTSGAFDYITAIRNAVKEVAEKWVTVIRYLGRSEQLDVAVRRTVLTGVAQTVGELQMTRAKEMNVNLMQVSAHVGARNRGKGPMNHESWQGKVYSIVGSTPEYPNLAEVTGLGTMVGLHGVNCRHSMYPFFEGISERLYSQKELDGYASRKVTYQGREMSVYEATQEQRRIERKIREWKRQEGALDAAGLDHTAETAKVREWQGEMRKFVKETGLIRQGEREQIQNPRKTIGMSFLSGDSHLSTTSEARQLGESENGWNKNKKILLDEYLPKYKLKDDVDETIGFWGGPEPSFNARVSGKTENLLKMVKAWGRDYHQQAMAVILPNPKGAGGRLIWDFGRELNDKEMDRLFNNLDLVNKEFAKLHPDTEDYFGITTKGSQIIEFWFSDENNLMKAKLIIDQALNITSLPIQANIVKGYDFILLFSGSDY